MSELVEDNQLLGNVIVPSLWKRNKVKGKHNFELDSRNKVNYSDSMSSSHSFESSKDSIPSEIRQKVNMLNNQELPLNEMEKESDVSSSIRDQFDSN